MNDVNAIVSVDVTDQADRPLCALMQTLKHRHCHRADLLKGGLKRAGRFLQARQDVLAQTRELAPRR